MRVEAAKADRFRQARQAARSWEAAGAIDGAARAAVEEAHPDDRVRLGPALRTLVYGFTALAALALVGIFGIPLRGDGWKVLLLLFGALYCVASDFLRGPLRRAQGGVESGAGAVGVTLLTIGLAWLLIDGIKPGGSREPAIVLGTAALLFGAAAMRWGSNASAVVATLGLFGLLAQSPAGRLLWIVTGLVAGPLLVRAGRSDRLPPAHRRSCELAGGLALLGLYAAVNPWSLDTRWVESLAWHHGGEPPAGTVRFLAAVATALLPLALVGAGLAARIRLLLDLGLLTVIASLVTLRFYAHVAPLWVVLIAGGSAALGLGLLVRRWLHGAPGQERSGFTGEPLFGGGPSRAVEVAGVLATLAPGAQAAPSKEGFTGEGGRMGGAGASGSY